MNTPKQKLKEITKSIKDLNEQYQAMLKECSSKVGGLLQELVFAEYPEVHAFRWYQYTPYFNDGDSCEFGVYYDSLCIQLEEDGEFYGEWDEYDEKYSEVAGKISKILSEFPEDLLESAYGDHAEIIITRDDVSIDRYEHD